MSSHSETARALFLQGYNCAQSVFAAFCDVTGMDMESALRLSAPLGAGVGRLREVCGAVTAVSMVAGCQYGFSDPNDGTAKADLYRLVQSLAFKFQDQYGAYVCRTLLGLLEGADDPVPAARTGAYYAERPCADFVAYAAELLDAELEKRHAPQT